ncbi:MAG: hypothetical protein ABI628_08145 [Chloroflexota bacterium]
MPTVSGGSNLTSLTPGRGHQESPLTIELPDLVEVHPRLRALFEALAFDGPAWCLLRGETELDGRPGDIDILVAPVDLHRFRRVARAHGFVRLPAQGYGSHLFLIAYDRDSDRWLKLDVVTELAFGPAFAWRFPGTAGILGRRQAIGATSVLADGDAFWALLLHGLLDKRRLDEAKRQRLGELAAAARDRGPLARALEPLLPDDWDTDRIVDAVERGEWERPDDLGRELAAVLRRRDRIKSARGRIARPVARRATRLVRVARPRGLTVALVGDPALVRRAATELGATIPMPVRSLAMSPHSQSFRRGLRIRLHRGTGLVVYSANELADLPARRGTPADLLSCPPPDLVIVLDPPRPSAPVDEALGICPTAGARSDVSTVDATLPAGEIRRSIAGLVWDRLTDRWNALDRRSAEP